MIQRPAPQIRNALTAYGCRVRCFYRGRQINAFPYQMEKQTMKNRKRWKKDDRQLFLLSLPTVAWFVLFCYLPMFGLIIAFKHYQVAPGKGFIWSLFCNSPWTGLDNFRFLFANNAETTFNMFRNTLGYNLIFLVLDIVVPVLLAMMISNIRSRRLARLSQTALFLPHFLSWIVVSYFVFGFLSSDHGLVNRILSAFGAEPVMWYQGEAIRWWPWILIFLHLWKTIGYSMVVYLAAINGVDPVMYEAAMIDGAGKLQQAVHITLPSLRPVIVMMFILATGRIFNSDFGLFYRATRNSGSLTGAYLTLDVYVYNSIFNNSRPVFGYISAAGALQSLLGCVTILLTNLAVRRVDSENALI